MMSFFDSFQKKLITLQYEGRSGALELMKIDATVEEGHSLSMQVTDHEVEDGSNISDHTVRAPDALTLRGIVSDDPISLFQALTGNVAGVVGGIVGGKFGNFGATVATGAASKISSKLFESSEEKRSALAWSALEYAQREAIPLTIITALKSYTNMMLTNVSAPITPRNSKALEFTATFKKVNIIQSETVDVPLSSLEPKGAAKKKNEGKKPKGSVDPGSKEATRGASVLSQLTGAGA